MRDEPAYGLTEAARYLKLPAATLRSWFTGQSLIKPAQKEPTLLSFYNLIEAHVLRSLRTEHGVAIKEVRQAIKYAGRKLDIERFLLSKKLCAYAGDVFLDEYGKLINLPASGRLAMRCLLEAHLKRLDWDKWPLPVRLYPYVATETPAGKRIAIDPAIAFGRPVVVRAGISTSAIAERIDAGETVADLAKDYDLELGEVEEAVLYECAA